MTIKNTKKSAKKTEQSSSSSSSMMQSTSSTTKQSKSSGKQVRYIDVKVEKEDPLSITELNDHSHTTIAEHYTMHPDYIITEAPSIPDLSQTTREHVHVADMALSTSGEFMSKSLIQESATSHQSESRNESYHRSSQAFETSNDSGFLDTSGASTTFIKNNNGVEGTVSFINAERANNINTSQTSTDKSAKLTKSFEKVTEETLHDGTKVVTRERSASRERVAIPSPAPRRKKDELTQSITSQSYVNSSQQNQTVNKQQSSKRDKMYRIVNGQQVEVDSYNRDFSENNQHLTTETVTTNGGPVPTTTSVRSVHIVERTVEFIPDVPPRPIVEETSIIREGESFVSSEKRTVSNSFDDLQSSSITAKVFKESKVDHISENELNSEITSSKLVKESLDDSKKKVIESIISETFTDTKNVNVANSNVLDITNIAHESSSTSKNMQKSSDSSYVYEVVNGKERIIDSSNREWGDVKESRLNESSLQISGTGVTPQSEYAKSTYQRESNFDTGIHGVPSTFSNVKEESVMIKDGKQIASTNEQYSSKYTPPVIPRKVDGTNLSIQEINKSNDVTSTQQETSIRDVQTSYDRSTGGWNGKFVYEKPVQKKPIRKHHLQRQDTEEAIILSSKDISDFNSITDLRKIIETTKNDVTIKNESIVINRNIEDSILQEIIDTVKRYPFKKIEKVTYDRKINQELKNTIDNKIVEDLKTSKTSTNETVTKEFDIEKTKSQTAVIRHITENGITRNDITFEDVIEDERIRTDVYVDKFDQKDEKKTTEIKQINIVKETDVVDRKDTTYVKEEIVVHEAPKVTKLVTKEQCICEICTCGRHRCPHNDVPEPLFEVEHTTTKNVTSYNKDFEEKHVTKVEAIHHEDHLRLEGKIDTPERPEWKPAERQKPLKPQDNLKQDGPFEAPKPEEWKPAERPVQIRPKDNLKQEGAFEKPEVEEWRPAERPVQIRPRDNLKQDGPFEQPQVNEWRPAERPVQVRPKDNLKQDGPFEQPQVEEWRPAERPVQIRPKDNLKQDGPFEQPQVNEWRPAERPVQVRPKDNLKQDGPFEQPQVEEWRPAERPVQIRPKDNLKQDGPFEQPQVEEWRPAERPVQIRPKDNLKQDGPFEQPEVEEWRPAERPVQIRPKDNLKQDGPFAQPKPEEWRPAERPVQIRPKDNLKQEGSFEQPQVDEWRPAERPVQIRPKDNLKQDGPFEQPKKEEWQPAERQTPKRPIDNLTTGGDFTDVTTNHLEYTGILVERPKLVRRNTWTKLEGDFTSETTNKSEYVDFSRTDRKDITTTVIHRQDNLINEGKIDFTTTNAENFTGTQGTVTRHQRRRTWTKEDFEKFYSTDELQSITTSQDQYRKYENVEVRRAAKKPQDNLKQDGPFEQPKKDEWRPAERPVQVRPKDNLKQEGSFEKQKTEEWRPAERPKQVRPKDNLKQEGSFEKQITEEWRPAERPVQVRPKDNLKQEGSFEKQKTEEWRPAERPKQVRPKDNLKQEGSFEKPKTEEWRPAERPVQVRPKDNLKQEGSFEKQKTEEWRPAERPVQVKPKDNLKQEGSFEKQITEEWRPAERPVQVRPKDNLKQDGPFEQPKVEEWRPADRPVQIRPKDNLKQDGPFEEPIPQEWKPAERPKQVRPKDNLKQEGSFEKQKTEEWRPAERPVQVKPKDNLKQEGAFEKQKTEEWRPAERPVQVRPKDNLKQEGSFEKQKTEEWRPAERPVQVRPKDNLKQDGPFEQPKIEEWRPADRPVQIRPKDNLKQDGPFEKPIPQEWKPAERPVQVRPKDNLKQDGAFEKPVPQEWKPAERPVQVRPKDNLKQDGPFEKPKTEEWKPAERPVPVRPKDNLKQEGPFEKPSSQEWKPAERPTQIRPKDNLKQVGPFETPKPQEWKPAERPTPKKPKDNLKQEGPFEKPKPKEWQPAEKVTPKIPKDTLKLDGEFTRPKEKEIVTKVEKVKAVKQQDNLKLDGKMDVTRRQDYNATKIEKVEQVIHQDTLKLEGTFDSHRSRDDYKQFDVQKRVVAQKKEDNLKNEGTFYIHEKVETGPAEKRYPIRQQDNLVLDHKIYEVSNKKHDNLKMDTKVDKLTITGENINYNIEKGDRATIVKHKDNLKMEGKMENIKSTDTYKVVKGEKVKVIKREDNIKIEGLFKEDKENRFETKQIVDSSKTTKGGSKLNETISIEKSERRTPIRQVDNLKVGTFEHSTAVNNVVNSVTNSFKTSKNIDEKSESFISQEKRSLIKQVDNREEWSPSITSTPIKPKDNLRVDNFQQYSSVQRIRSSTPESVRSKSKERVEKLERDERSSSRTRHEESLLASRKRDETIKHNETSLTKTTYQPSPRRRLVGGKLILEKTEESHISIGPEGVGRETLKQSSSHLQHDVNGFNSSQIDHSRQLNSRNTSYSDSSRNIESRNTVLSNNSNHMDSRNSSVERTSRIINNALINEQNTSRYVGSNEKAQNSQSENSSKYHKRSSVLTNDPQSNNAILLRKGLTTTTEAIHLSSSAAAVQKKSLGNLEERGDYISNSTQSNDRKSISSMHRSSRDHTDNRSSSKRDGQSTVNGSVLKVGGDFYGQSESRSYGNFQQVEKVERIESVNRRSHKESLGDTCFSTSYRREYHAVPHGPCPATLLETSKAPFKHTRDTREHKFYSPKDR